MGHVQGESPFRACWDLPCSLYCGPGREWSVCVFSPSSDTHVCAHICMLAPSLSLSLRTPRPALRLGHKASTQGRLLPLANFEAPKMSLALCQVLLGMLNSQGACGGHEQR